MKKNYIAPSMKVRKIESEEMMAASEGNGLTSDGNGGYTQGVGGSTETVNGSNALSNYNVWGSAEDDE